MSRITLALLATFAALLLTACGGGGNGQTSGATTSPAPATSPGPTPTRGLVAPNRLCQMGQQPLESYHVQVTARWKGKDRVVIEGSADLPTQAQVTYWICQDGEVTASLVWASQPTIKGGQIRAESKLVDAQVGPAFDPNAQFFAVLLVSGEPVNAPYFTIKVPVEGKPG
jgi:hypothetical protein